MLMVIFGAGASFGSLAGNGAYANAGGEGGDVSRVRRPPLTKSLFSAELSGYANKYPASRPVIVLLREHMAANPDALIEDAIGRFSEAASADPERARHMLALRFYLSELIATETQQWWDRLNGFTHYADLLARLGQWRSSSGEPIVLVTFNYDELLDHSLEAQAGNWQLTGFDSYVTRDDWRLYKLHGSVGWSRALPRPDGTSLNAGPAELILRANELDLDTGTLRPEPWERLKDQMSREAVYVPGIAVPTDRKDTFECLPEHVQRFVTEVQRVDRVLTIGWRATERHVREMLSEHLRPGYQLAICDVTDEDAQTIIANLGLAGKKAAGGARRLTHGFTGLIAGDELERWLGPPVPGLRTG